MSRYEKTLKRKQKKKDLTRMMLVSYMCIIFCLLCLTGTTYAWFTASQSTCVMTIQSANYDVEVAVKNEAQVNVTGVDGSYALEVGTYNVTINASGTATKGYCIVEIGDTKYYAKPGNENPSSFIIVAHDKTSLKVTEGWGDFTPSDEFKINNGDSIVVGTAKTTVQEPITSPEMEEQQDISEDVFESETQPVENAQINN